MKFFDTTVLVAASLTVHPHHEGSRRLLAQLTSTRKGACGAHTLAETYSVLTRTVGGYGIPPSDAAKIIDNARANHTIVSLTEKEVIETIHSISERAMRGGIVYDALLLACARKVGATKIYTHNLKHFRQVAPDLASRIEAP